VSLLPASAVARLLEPDLEPVRMPALVLVVVPVTIVPAVEPASELARMPPLLLAAIQLG